MVEQIVKAAADSGGFLAKLAPGAAIGIASAALTLYAGNIKNSDAVVVLQTTQSRQAEQVDSLQRSSASTTQALSDLGSKVDKVQQTLDQMHHELYRPR